MRRTISAGALALAASAYALIAAPSAGATTYNNDAPIIMPGPTGKASPYPSQITVSGTAGPITDVNLGLDGVTHTAPEGIAIALVAPSGQALEIQCGAGGLTDAAGLFLTFDDLGAQLPDDDPLASGTYKPTSYCADGPFPPPGPLSYGSPPPFGSATFATAFNGLSAIGTWNLFVQDLVDPDSGSIPGGWSLDVHPDVTPLPATDPAPPKKKCKKAKKRKRASAAKKKKGCKKRKKKRK
jgi:hypothetical protein